MGLTESPAGSGVCLHTNNPYRFNGKEQGTMWDSGYTKPKTDRTPTVTFDFGKAVSIGSLGVWNYNEKSPYNDRGFKVVEILQLADRLGSHFGTVASKKRSMPFRK